MMLKQMVIGTAFLKTVGVLSAKREQSVFARRPIEHSVSGPWGIVCCSTTASGERAG